MCGRTCLSLDPSAIVQACKYNKCKESSPDEVVPEIRNEYNLGRQFSKNLTVFLNSEYSFIAVYF